MQPSGASLDSRQLPPRLSDYGSVGDRVSVVEQPDGVQQQLRPHASITVVPKPKPAENGESQPLTESERDQGRGDAPVSINRAATSSATNRAATMDSNGKSCSGDKKLNKVNAWILRVGPSCLSNPDVQKHKKIILTSAFFCVFGIILCSIGTALTARQPSALYNLVFVIGGLVIFVPGIYYLVYIVRAYRGHEGYSFEDLPPTD